MVDKPASQVVDKAAWACAAVAVAGVSVPVVLVASVVVAAVWVALPVCKAADKMVWAVAH